MIAADLCLVLAATLISISVAQDATTAQLFDKTNRYVVVGNSLLTNTKGIP